MGRVFSWLLQILGLVGLPTDIKIWRNVVIPAIPSVIAGGIAYLRDAPIWLLALVVFGLFVVLFLVSFPAERWYLRWKARRRESEPPQEQRIGWRTRGGSVRARRTRIRNQDVGIDSEKTDWDAEDTDIK